MGTMLSLIGASLYWGCCYIAETGLIPDWLIRIGVRHFLNRESAHFRRLAATTRGSTAALDDAFVADILNKPSR